MDRVYTTLVGVGLHGTLNVAMKLVCYVNYNGLRDLLCGTKCHVTPSPVAT